MLEHEKDYLPLIKSPVVRPEEPTFGDNASSTSNRPSSPSHASLCSIESCTECPRFRHFTQSTDLELFYDLFFVANLTVFTYVHEVNDADSLKQYVGFFSILWFTWYQVSIYDVRFAMDSVFERACKAVQFIVMVGFAICAPEFKVGQEETQAVDEGETPSTVYLKALTLVLVISRLTLVLQYLQTLWFARAFKRAMAPLSIITAVYIASGTIYLGLFWALHTETSGENHAYIAWYCVSLSETLLITATSCYHRNISFHNTHLVQRMSLLTLIILGEGAIAIAESCQEVVFSRGIFSFTDSVGAELACAVLNLYFMYMLYFDWIHEERFGTIRQQVWAVLHFPLHVALVLAVEGAGQGVRWNAAVRRGNGLVGEVRGLEVSLNRTSSPAEWEDAARELNKTANVLLERQLQRASSLLETAEGLGNFRQVGSAVVPAVVNGVEDGETAGNAIWWLTGILYETVFEIAGFHAPESGEERREAVEVLSTKLDFAGFARDYWYDDAVDNISKAFNVFTLTFGYFFVATGVFVIMCAILAALNKGRHTKMFWIRLVFMACVGTGLSLLATMIATGAERDFVLGPWMLPTVTISLFCIVVLNSVKLAGLHDKKHKGSGRERESDGEVEKARNDTAKGSSSEVTEPPAVHATAPAVA